MCKPLAYPGHLARQIKKHSVSPEREYPSLSLGGVPCVKVYFCNFVADSLFFTHLSFIQIFVGWIVGILVPVGASDK